MATAIQRGPRIGLVDDAEMFAESMALILREVYACEVSVATDCATAERLVRDRRLDALLLDLHMPGVKGETLVRRMRELAPDLPIFVLTGNTTPSARQACLDAGATGVLSKGLGLRAIVSALKIPEPSSV